ncbi:HAD family hydrolase [Chloroflexota bacterium]
MSNIKVVSLDIEGTMITPDFSRAVWYNGVSTLYAKRYRISFEEATATVVKEYEEVGDQRLEWYDIKYWFQCFQFGDYWKVLEEHKHQVACYPELSEALHSLGKDNTLIAITSSTREFLPYLLTDIEDHFTRIFSSISDYSQLKTPSFYLTICQEMGISPHEMAHIGDNWQFDFLMAREAGVKTFHIERRDELKNEESLTSLIEVKTRLQDK